MSRTNFDAPLVQKFRSRAWLCTVRAGACRRPQWRMLSLSIPIALITCEFRASDSAAASASAACRPAWPRRSEVAFWLISAISARAKPDTTAMRSEEHTSELQSRQYLVCRLLLEKKKRIKKEETD